MKDTSKNWQNLFLIFLFSLVSVVRAEDSASLTIELPSGNKSIIIDGVADEKVTSFSGTVRLIVKGGNENPLSIKSLADDLEDNGYKIDRTEVNIPPISLTKEQPQDVKITINNVKRPGNYKGVLKFWIQSQGYDKAENIEITLNITEKLQVNPIIDNLTFQITRCDWFVDCLLAKLLLPEKETSDQWQILLDNLTKKAQLTVSGITMVMDRGILVEPQLINPSQVLSTGINSVPVKIEPDSMPPDSYRGNMRFKLKELDDPVIISTSLNVRNGPFWALCTILVGILVGRMARDMESSIAQKQKSLLPRWYKLQQSASEVLIDQHNQQTLDQDLFQAKESIESNSDTMEVTSKLLDQLVTKVAFLLDLQTIEKNLPNHAKKDQIVNLINSCRDQILRNKTDEAKTTKQSIVETIEQLRSDGNLSIKDDAMAAFARISSAADSALTNTGAALNKANKFQQNIWRRLLVTLSGIHVTAETRYWIFRPIISLLILILLMLLGLQTLYVKSGPAFGVGGLYDYLSLFLWGISADVAQRTLFNMPQGK